MAFLLVNPFRASLVAVAVADNRRLLLDVILVVVDAWARFAHGTPTFHLPLVPAPRSTPSGNDDISSNFVAVRRVHSHRNAGPGSVLWRCLRKCIENICWQFEKMKIFTSGPRTERERVRERGRQRDKPWDGNCWNASPFCLAAAKLKLWPNVVAIIFIDFLYILTYFYLVWSASSASPSAAAPAAFSSASGRKVAKRYYQLSFIIVLLLLSCIVGLCFRILAFIFVLFEKMKRENIGDEYKERTMRRRRAWAITFWDDWMKIAFISYWCHYAWSRKKLTKSNQK